MHEHLSDAARLKVEMRRIDELTPYANNARTHSKSRYVSVST